MMVLTRNNFKEMVEILLNYERGMTSNSECFSSSDVRREIEARNDVDKILTLLVKQGVNIEKELSELAEKFDTNFINGEGFKESNDDFSIKFKSVLFDRYIKDNYPEYFVEDTPIVEVKEYCRELEIGNSRFTYQYWDVSNEAIECLKSTCSVFNAASEILEKALNYYNIDGEVKEIHCIRDNSNHEDINCSHYVVYTEGKSNNHALIIQMGGSHKDAILFDTRSKQTEYIFLLDGADKWCIRRYSNHMDEACLRVLKHMENYKKDIE